MDNKKEFYLNEMKLVKTLNLQAINSITLVSLSGLLADYYSYLEKFPNSNLDEFYLYKKNLYISQKNDNDDWKKIIENDKEYQHGIDKIKKLEKNK